MGREGTLQTNNTGVCSRCLRHTGFVPTHGVGAFPVYTAYLGSRLLSREVSEASPRLYALPRSKLLMFRYSGTPQRRRLCWACVLCPSQARAAQVTRCLASVVAATYHLPCPCRSVFWVYNWRTFSGVPCVSSGELISGCDCPADVSHPESQEVLVSKEACLQFGR